jgi:hypothetical protein
MGNGGALPSAVQVQVIVPALDYMFDPNGGLPQTQVNFRLLARFYRNLGDPADHDQGISLRQRTLRHLAFLLTDHIFDTPNIPGYGYPNRRFRLWLRYLTWLEHFATNCTVKINGQYVTNVKPADAIKHTLLMSIRTNREIKFDWQPGGSGGGPELTVDITRPADVRQGMTIALTSKREDEIPDTVTSDYDDILRQE